MNNIKKVVAVIIVLIAVFIGLYLYVDNKDLVIKEDEDNLKGEISVGDVKNNIEGKRISYNRVDFLSSNWDVDYAKIIISKQSKSFGDYDINLREGFPISEIFVSKNEQTYSLKTDVFIPTLPDSLVMVRQENVSSAEFFVNPILNKIYAFYTFGNSNIGGERKVYEADFLNGKVSEINLPHNKFSYPKSYRFSPDYTTFSYITDETDFNSVDNKIYFHIIDLLEKDRVVSFLLPDSKRGSVNSEFNYWVPAWQFVGEDTLEFTLYKAKGNDVNGYVQLSDKELWSYNLKTGELELLETVTF